MVWPKIRVKNDGTSRGATQFCQLPYMQWPAPYAGRGSGIGRYDQKSLYQTPPVGIYACRMGVGGGGQARVCVTWPNWVPPPHLGPVVFDSNFWSRHFIEKSGIFVNARRFYYAKITLSSNEMSCTGSGNNLKRKFMVLGPILAYFSYTNEGQNVCICIGKID